MEGTTTIFSQIAAIWTAIVEWLGGTFGTIEALFWADGALTFLGTMCVISIGIGIFFVLVQTITNFIKLRS